MASAPLEEAKIPLDEFTHMRRENLARWPTGDGVVLDEAVAYLKRLPDHKNLAKVTRRAVREGRCMTQPRGGFATFEMQKSLLEILDREGLADVVPTTTDSYTRNERFAEAARGADESEEKGRSMLNGFPVVNAGVDKCRELTEAVNKPIIALTGTSFPRLTGEITYAGGFTGYLGSGIAYTTSYTKETSVAEGIRNYQYLDRLVALYQEKGVELHRRQPGFLTGTNIPPCIAIAICIADALLAAAQGVCQYGLELGQTLHLVQDAVSIEVCGQLTREYLHRKGYDNVFTTVTSLHWMGAWPTDRAMSFGLLVYGGFAAAVGGALSVTTKSIAEAMGIPTPEENAEGLRAARMGIYLARDVKLRDLPEYLREKEILEMEVRAIVDSILEAGDGDVAIGTMRALEAGLLDVPWSPNRECKSAVMPARDGDGYLRLVDIGGLPFPEKIATYHRERLEAMTKAGGKTFGPDLAIDSVYELSEDLGKLMPPVGDA
ncbi:MAG: methylaspartate mutase subunit E [Alphaproteobacteria bacterium]|jgi:methylaspartate mutase epsilon subunit|nr:methylaspartate mutase subunit E [Alphaproteobacteria bacterium]